MSLTGSCLCGAVRYEANAEPVFSGHCHCSDCQKESGGGHATIAAVPDATVRISGPTAHFSKPGDSGKANERTFCSKCGSTLFSRPQAIAGLTLLRVGTLDNPSAIAPGVSVYTKRALAWDQPSPSLPGFPEMPPPS
jgi:hypothetical protein